MGLLCKRGCRPRAFRSTGAQVMAFTLVILPLLAMVAAVVDTAWPFTPRPRCSGPTGVEKCLIS